MRIFCALSILAALAAAPSPAAGLPADPGAPGPYAVGHTSFTIIDPTRDTSSPFHGRPVFVSIWYPVDAWRVTPDSTGAAYPLDPFYNKWPVSRSSDWEQFGLAPAYENVPPSSVGPFPLVLASPGFGARYFAFMYYGVRLASHGFVFALAQHYHDGYGNDSDLAAYQSPTLIDAAMAHRPLDMLFMLDAVLARHNSPSEVLYNAVRPDLVAAMGHSLGGYAAMVLGGGDDLVCGSPEDPLTDTCLPAVSTLPDPRIKAIVPLDASSQLLHFAELARITIPTMALGEAWDQVQDWQARQHAAIPGPPSYRADILNTVHASFGGNCIAARVLGSYGAIPPGNVNKQLSAPQCSTSLPQMEVNRLAAKYAIAFLKTYLVGEGGYQRILTPGWALTREPDVEFFVTEKGGADAFDGDWPDSFWYFPHQPGGERARALRDPSTSPRVERIEP